MKVCPAFFVSMFLSSVAVANFTHLHRVLDLGLNKSEFMNQVPSRINSKYHVGIFNFSQTNTSFSDAISSTKLENTTRYVEEQVGRFVAHLKTFITESSFIVLKFELEIEELKQNLLKLHSDVQLEIHSPGLQVQFEFATHMFLVMVESAKNMEHFRVNSNAGYPLVYKVIELNVRVLALYDAYGRLDTHIDGYLSELSRLRASLDFWSERFQNLILVSPEVSGVFQKHSKRLEETFKFLISQVPGQSYLAL